MPSLVETFIVGQKISNELRAVKSPLRICPIGDHLDYQYSRVTGMTIDSSVDMIYSPREDNYVQIQSLDFPNKEFFSIRRLIRVYYWILGNIFPRFSKNSTTRLYINGRIKCCCIW